MKSWAIPDGDGGTFEGSSLGQEAALCDEKRRLGAGNDMQEFKKTMAPLHTSATQNTCPVYLKKEDMRG